MRTPRKTTAILLAGGGSAAAGDSGDDARRFGPGEPFDDLAGALGVEAGELRDALADFGSRQRTERKDTFAAALAAALEKVVNGATRDRVDGPRDFVNDLAGELGVSPDRLEDALREARPLGRDGDRPGPGLVEPHLRGLAAALDVTQAELRAALREMWDERSSHRADVSDELAEFLAG